MRQLRILLVLCLVTLAPACMMTQQEGKVLPPKPTLKIEEKPDGGICLDKKNTYKLMDYIYQLEETIED